LRDSKSMEPCFSKSIILFPSKLIIPWFKTDPASIFGLMWYCTSANFLILAFRKKIYWNHRQAIILLRISVLEIDVQSFFDLAVRKERVRSGRNAMGRRCIYKWESVGNHGRETVTFSKNLKDQIPKRPWLFLKLYMSLWNWFLTSRSIFSSVFTAFWGFDFGLFFGA